MPNPWPESDPAVMAPVEEHEELRHVVHAVLLKYADHDRIRTATTTDRGFSEDLWNRLNRELEVGKLAIAEERGGHGFGFRELGVLLEETGAALLPEPVLASSVLGAQALALADRGPDEAVAPVDAMLNSVMTGERIVTVSLEDPTAHQFSGLAATRTDRGYQVQGLVPALLQGSDADWAIAAAASEEGPLLVAIAVADGVIEECEVVDYTRRRADLRVTGAPAQVLVGPQRCTEVLHLLRLIAQVAVAAEHTGIVGHLLTQTQAYVVDRHQFGRPIGSFQVIKHRLADVLVDLERARSASRYAAAALDEDPLSAELAVSVASATCADAVMRTAHEAVQLHGGIGFTWEHWGHFYLRRALGDEGLLGNSGERRAQIADLVGV